MAEHPPHIVVTDSAGVSTAFLLRAGSTIRRDPASGQTQTTTIGESDRRGDTRTPEVIWTGVPGGMGEFEYEELNGITTFTDSLCDTRNAGMICLPPAAVALGGTVATAQLIEYIGAATCRLFGWTPNQAVAASYYDPTAAAGVGAWTSVAALTFLWGFAQYNGLYVVVRDGAGTNGVYTSPDARTWTARNVTAVLTGCCVHDQKFYVWNASASTIMWNTDPTTTTYTSSTAVLKRLPSENVVQLIEWQRGGRAMIFIVTNRRLLWYDEDADAFLLYDDGWNQPGNPALFFPRAAIGAGNGDLYLVFSPLAATTNQMTVMHYSGRREILGPNTRGGLPAGSQMNLRTLASGQYWLFLWGHQAYGTANVGRVLALNEQNGFHTMLGNAALTTEILGGGYGGGLLYTSRAGGVVYEQAVPDDTALPLFRPAGQITYPTTGTYTIEFAYTDGGTENILKRALWVTIGARDMSVASKAAGTPANTTIQVEYLRSVDTTWTSIGTLTHANVFPAVLPINNGFGVSFRQIKLRLTLATTDPNVTPIVTSVALAYQRTETIRDAYTLEVDLRPTSHPLYQGLDRAQLLARLDAYRALGTPVSLAFAGGEWASAPAGARNMPRCTFSYGGVEDPDSGPGVYQCQFIDLAAPASGDG